MKDRMHTEAMAEAFQADPSYAAALLAEVLSDGDLAELAILVNQLAAMKDMGAEASGELP